MTNNSIKAAFQRFWEHVVAQLNGKADVNHTHDYADSVHNHDDIYYTESEIDAKFSEVSESIDNLTYSWNDLEDKPFSEENSEITVVAEAEYVAEDYAGQDYFDLVMLEDIIPNETYRIILNGVEYIAVADGTNLSFGIDPHFGDTLYGIETNYFIMYGYNEGQPSTYTIAVYRDGTTIKPLDPKFLPEECATTEYVDEAISTHTHSWNGLKDRPFGEVETILWEGDYNALSKLETAGVDYKVLSRISDVPMTKEDLLGYQIDIYRVGEFYQSIHIDSVDNYTDNENYVSYMNAIFLVPEDFAVDDYNDVKKGVWVQWDEWFCAQKVYKKEFKLLDEQCISSTIARKADVESALESYETKSDATAKLTEAKAYADEVGSGLQTQLNTIVNNPDTEGIINSINEFTQYITEHGEIAEGFRTDISALETEVAGLAAIAKTGSTDDLVQGEMVLVFDCGTAAEWIDENASTDTLLDEAILGETTV